MFRETLLESAPFTRNRKRWPMALAVALEVVICIALIALPFLSTTVISVAAHPLTFQPPEPLREANRPQASHISRGGPGSTAIRANVVTLSTRPTICFVHCPTTEDVEIASHPDINFRSGETGFPDGLASCNNCGSKLVHGPVPISNLAPGSLIYRVEPVYPRVAALTRAHGIVRMHAIIATDGTIQKLEVIDGPPSLIPAARDAVRQWRYRPYILNGQPVEVETMITVSFKGADE